MKFVFKKLGPIKEAELELGDLTIIAGRNNTGKTYVAYTLYGFLLMRPPVSPEMQAIAKTVLEEGQVKFRVSQETIRKNRREVAQRMAQDFSKESLAELFSTSTEDFEDTSIEVMIGDEFPEHTRKTLELPTGDTFTFTYSRGEICIARNKISRKSPPIGDLSWALSSLYFLFLLPEFPESFILPAERSAISLFYKELDFTKKSLVEALQEIGKGREKENFLPFMVIDKFAGLYARPIRDNIDYARKIPELKKWQSEIYDSELFKDISIMMKGAYRSSGDAIRFRSKSRKGGFDIPLHLASSSVRELSSLYFFLRHIASKNQLLIIDEPESHLDTANQIQFARLLARAVHAGLKVLITTHSDYIVKEINNLLMLSEDFEEKDEVVKKLGYSKHDFLKPESVRAYVAENNSLTHCAIDRLGINMPVFDTTIDAINRVSSELSVRLKYEGEE